MKYKFLIPITFSIILGIVIGKTFFTNYNSNPTQVFYEGEGAYFVELGIYWDERRDKRSRKLSHYSWRRRLSSLRGDY